mmetsp:Transcript_35826/g.78433  ORF Transcript_35826/g.78433 Transcript_35826/m.78433 type:complete len:213 (-) Transcript_35826:236-874(-)
MRCSVTRLQNERTMRCFCSRRQGLFRLAMEGLLLMLILEILASLQPLGQADAARSLAFESLARPLPEPAKVLVTRRAQISGPGKMLELDQNRPVSGEMPRLGKGPPQRTAPMVAADGDSAAPERGIHRWVRKMGCWDDAPELHSGRLHQALDLGTAASQTRLQTSMAAAQVGPRELGQQGWRRLSGCQSNGQGGPQAITRLACPQRRGIRLT